MARMRSLGGFSNYRRVTTITVLPHMKQLTSGTLFVLSVFRLLAQCRRDVVLQQMGSNLGYTGRGANAFRKAARDPER